MLGIADSVIGVAGKVLDKFVEDKDLKTKLEAELKQQMVSLDLAQAQANIESAKHSSLFVSGARPAILWICAFALGWQFILHPIAIWGVALWAPGTPIPAINSEGLMTLTLSLLGLGGMRTAEKWKGVARNNMNAKAPRR
jgi:hypothetical protein